MKGFGIWVKNDLLEPKHVVGMGEAVWLYLWLLDKMTSVNENGIGKVLGNQPVTFELVQSELGLTVRTYRRWVDKLRDAGYIQTLRTPRGLIITVTKAQKVYGKRSAKSGTSNSDRPQTAHHEVPKVAHQTKSDVPKTPSDVPKMATRSAKSAHPIKTIQDNTKTIQNTTNVVSAPARYGKPEINEMFDFWAAEVQYNIESKKQANRNACSNLLKKYGRTKLEQLIKGVSMAQSDPYAPRITDFCDLQSKTNQLVAWGKTKMHGDISAKGVKL